MTRSKRSKKMEGVTQRTSVIWINALSSPNAAQLCYDLLELHYERLPPKSLDKIWELIEDIILAQEDEDV